MDQRDFTDYIVAKFLEAFPRMTQYTVDDHFDVGYLELASSNEKLKILVSTRDMMLTIGFSAGPGLFGWHRHMPENKSLNEQMREASTIIREITHCKKGIVYSSVLGYFPGDLEDLENIRKHREEGEIIELGWWRDF